MYVLLTPVLTLPVMEYLGGGEIQWREKISYDPPAYKPLLKVDQARRILRDAMLGLEYRKYFSAYST